MKTATIEIRLKPGAKNDAIDAAPDGVIAMRVTSPPVEGKANAHALKLIAEKLRIPKSSCRIIRGATARTKVIAIEGKDFDEVRKTLLDDAQASRLDA